MPPRPPKELELISTPRSAKRLIILSACFCPKMPRRLFCTRSLNVPPFKAFLAMLLVLLSALAAFWPAVTPSWKSWINLAAWTSCSGPDTAVNRPRNSPPVANTVTPAIIAFFLNPLSRAFCRPLIGDWLLLNPLVWCEALRSRWPKLKSREEDMGDWLAISCSASFRKLSLAALILLWSWIGLLLAPAEWSVGDE